MTAKNHKKIQPLCHFFGLHIYYKVKKSEEFQITRLEYVFFIFTGSFSDFTYITGLI